MAQVQDTFIAFVFKDRVNCRYAAVFAGASALLWWVFKYFYPNPNIIFDSYYYISATVSGADVNAWPIGYSKILRWIGSFSHAAGLVLAIQYFFLQGCLLFFFFTSRFFFGLGKLVSTILLLLLLFNPIFIYTSNLLLSDAFFTAFSLLWLTHLLWIVFRPRPYMVVTQALLLLLTFSIRYNALYYPLIAALAFLLSRQKLYLELCGIVLQCILVGGFVLYTTHEMETGYQVKQFSPFGGWKLANDALYMYAHVYKEKRAAMPARFRALDQRVRQYFDGRHYDADLMQPDATWGSYYMYIHPSPLIQYMFSIYGKDPPNVNLNFEKFAKMGTLYQDYGTYLVKEYPAAFAQYFVWPNVRCYFSPLPEVLVDSMNAFSLRHDYLGTPVVKWFGVKTLTAKPQYIQARTLLFSFYPIFSTIVHLLFVLSIIVLLLLRSYRELSKEQLYGVLVFVLLWVCDFLFSVLAAGVVLRYQLFITSVELSFVTWSLAFIYGNEQRKAAPAAPATGELQFIQ